MSFWGKLGKIAAIAGAGAATYYTGGAAAPLLKKAITNARSGGADTAAGTGVAYGGGTAGGGGTGGRPGILSTAAQIAGAAAPTAEAIAAGRAQGRVQEGVMNQRQDQNAEQRYRDVLAENAMHNRYNESTANYGLSKADVDLARRKFSLAAPGQRASNSVRGDILANAQDTHITGLPKGVNVPTITGGLRPSMFSANTRALGGAMSSQALQDQLAGDNFEALPNMPDYLSPPAAPGLTPLPQAGTLDKILTTAGTVGSLASTIPEYEQILAKYRKKPTAPTTPPYVGDWEDVGVG